MFNWAVFFLVLEILGVIVGLISAVATLYALLTKQPKRIAVLTAATLGCFVLVAGLFAVSPSGAALAPLAAPGSTGLASTTATSGTSSETSGTPSGGSPTATVPAKSTAAGSASGSGAQPPTATPHSAPVPTPTHRTGQTTVAATELWHDSGVYARAGDYVEITYISGQWSYSPSQPLSDGNGPPEQFVCTQHYPADQCNNPINDAVEGSLVGRIGSQLLPIGDAIQVTAQQSGDVQLMINEYGLGDNRGALVVTIVVN